MKLSKIVDGKRFPYSVQQLRKDFPHVSFPKDLLSADLSAYDVVVDVDSPKEDKPSGRKSDKHQRVWMHQFLYALRERGYRVQFEAYMLRLEGHARDFWMTSPIVVKSSVYVKHFADTFKVKDDELDAIFDFADGVEE